MIATFAGATLGVDIPVLRRRIGQIADRQVSRAERYIRQFLCYAPRVPNAVRPLVSVVIPCLNQRRHLPDAIESAVSDDVPTEIIVVDDGSTDGSAALVMSRFPGARCIRQSGRGLAAARNRGIEAAFGEFIIFLNADDRLLPGAIDIAVRALSARPDCVMAYGRSVMIGSDGTTWPTAERPAVRSGHHAALLRTNLIWVPAMAILRREALLEAGGFALGFDAVADYDLYLRLTSRYAVSDHGHVVAAYRRQPDTIDSDASAMLRETLTVMRRNRPRDAHLQSAWHEGYRNWQEFYGTHLVEEICGHLHAHAAAPAARKAFTLARLAPQVFARELVRATRVMPQPRLGSGV